MPCLRTSVLVLLGASARGTVMPNGRDFPEECIHRLEEEHHVSSEPGLGDVLTNLRTGERQVLPPCPQKAIVKMERETAKAGYYSDWILNTVSVHPSIGRMASNWTVPPAPGSRGPVPGMSSIYLFNGLEDGNGQRGQATVILQPVLSYGKSGCVLNPLAGWQFTAFQVTAAGRAYCGPRISVREGDMLQGIMEITEKASGQDGTTTWNIVADAGSRGRSEHKASYPAAHKFNAAYLTLEGMVIYNCKALPGSGIDFTANVLSDDSGAQLHPSWKTEVRHPECKPAAAATGDVISMKWDNTAAVADVVV